MTGLIIKRAIATAITTASNKSRFKKITFTLNDQWIIYDLKSIRFYYYISRFYLLFIIDDRRSKKLRGRLLVLRSRQGFCKKL